MPKYYNKSRGPLPLKLNSGKSGSIAPKSWVTIDPEDECSPMVNRYKKKGLLVRQKIMDEAEPQKAPPPPEPEAPEPETAPEAPKEAPAPEPEVEEKLVEEAPAAEKPKEEKTEPPVELAPKRKKKGS
jgi:outer membrane biosynthesis protein TonB